MLKKDLKNIELIYNKLDKVTTKFAESGRHLPFSNTLGNQIDFALRNVKDGERKVSYPDIKEQFDIIVKDYNDCITLLPIIKNFIDKLKFELNKYKICPKCKGKQLFNPNYYMHDDPKECTKCDGHGVIKI